MDLIRQLQEEQVRNRQKRRSWFFFWLIMIDGVIMSFFQHIYWCFTLMLLLTNIGLVALGVTAFTRKEIFTGPLAAVGNYLVRTLWLVMSIGGLFIFFYSFAFWNYVLDLPDYISNNTEKTRGIAEFRTTTNRGHVAQTITIHDVEYQNTIILDEFKYERRVLELEYLPRTRYVVGIWSFGPEKWGE